MIGQGISAGYIPASMADLGAAYNAGNLILQRGAYELVKYGTAGVLLHPKTGRIGSKMFIELIHQSKRFDFMKFFGTKVGESVIKNGPPGN